MRAAGVDLWLAIILSGLLSGEASLCDVAPAPLLAKTKCHQARLWTYVRDDRAVGSHDPTAAVYYFSRDRSGEHPERHLAG
jgi:transposase